MTTTINVLRVRARAPEIRLLNAARDRVHFPARFNPITAMNELATTSIVTHTPAEPPAVGKHFAGLGSRLNAPVPPELDPAMEEADAAGGADDDDTANTTPATKRTLRKLISARLVTARNLAGLQQSHAAELLGYTNSAQISLHEKGQRTPPLLALLRAAEVYGVSVDFLVGMTDQALRDPALGLRASTVRGVRGIVNGLAETLVASISNHAALVGPDAVCSRAVLAAGSELIEALRVAQRDPAFDEVKGLARVTRVAEEFEQRLHEVAKAIKRFDDLDASLRSTIASAAANDEGDTE